MLWDLMLLEWKVCCRKSVIVVGGAARRKCCWHRRNVIGTAKGECWIARHFVMLPGGVGFPGFSLYCQGGVGLPGMPWCYQAVVLWCQAVVLLPYCLLPNASCLLKQAW